MTLQNLGNSLVSVMVEAQINPNFAELFRQRLIESRRQVLRLIIQRDVLQGELRTDIDIEATLDMIYGCFWYRLLVGHAPLDNTDATTLVEQVLQGIKS